MQYNSTSFPWKHIQWWNVSKQPRCLWHTFTLHGRENHFWGIWLCWSALLLEPSAPSCNLHQGRHQSKGWAYGQVRSGQSRFLVKGSVQQKTCPACIDCRGTCTYFGNGATEMLVVFLNRTQSSEPIKYLMALSCVPPACYSKTGYDVSAVTKSLAHFSDSCHSGGNKRTQRIFYHWKWTCFNNNKSVLCVKHHCKFLIGWRLHQGCFQHSKVVLDLFWLSFVLFVYVCVRWGKRMGLSRGKKTQQPGRLRQEMEKLP